MNYGAPGSRIPPLLSGQGNAAARCAEGYMNKWKGKEYKNMSDDARYIWYDKQGNGRNLYALFRKAFVINGNVVSAKINIFADTNYQLFINGTFVDFGPVRFDPRFPLYDTHDISSCLREGDNVIAVLVNCFGCKTYKAIKNTAGFIAWGTVVQEDNRSIDLNTGAGSWKCRKAEEYSRYAPKLSFVLNPADYYDQSHAKTGWKDTGFDDGDWLPAVEINNQAAWGKLSPRRIPYMRKDIIPLRGKVDILPLLNRETRYSFSVELPHYFEEDSDEFNNFIAFSTWVYSPEEQTVRVKVFWGEGWLNGEPLSEGTQSPDKSMCRIQTWHLKNGWNYYFGKVGVYFDVLDQYIAIPSGKGIAVSADKDMNSSYLFRHSPIITKTAYDIYLQHKILPYNVEEPLEEIGGWIYTSKERIAQSPCRETSWDDYGDAGESIAAEALNGHVFPVSDYPEGFSFMLDLKYMHLFLIGLSMEGVEGAVMDVTYAEHLSRDKLHLRHTFQYALGDRIICTRNSLDWSCVHPRGARYIKITVRNASKDVRLTSLVLRSANYPVERKGYFKCSDPALNEIWLMGERTQAANMEDAYVDCPGRERGMYIRDTIIQYHNNLVTFGDQALMQRCMELYGQSPDLTGRFRAVYPNTGNYSIADFSMETTDGYLAYYNNTGDIDRIRKDWEAIMTNLNWFHALADERPDLLLDAEWHLKKSVNAHYGGMHGDLFVVKGFMDNTGIHCVFSCTYLIALRSAKALAEALGKNEELNRLNKRINILEETIPKAFWNEELGCYSDNLNRTSHSAHASIYAIRAGVADGHQLSLIRPYLRKVLKSLFVNGYDPKEGVYMSPAFSFFIFDGLYKAGLPDVAEKLMKDGWGWMLTQGLLTCSEYFTLEDSLCHAWSGSPTYYLSRYVLGVGFPKGFGGDEAEIRVIADQIDHAEGAVPHVKGLIQVKWHMEDGKRVFDYVKGPEGVKIVVKA